MIYFATSKTKKKTLKKFVLWKGVIYFSMAPTKSVPYESISQ